MCFVQESLDWSTKPILKHQLGKRLSQSKLGKVYTAWFMSQTFTNNLYLALFSTGDLERLAKEVSTMLSFKHENVMSLIGVCIDGEMPLLIMPFMSNGNVLDFVRNNKESLFCVGECLTDKVSQSKYICNAALLLTADKGS